MGFNSDILDSVLAKVRHLDLSEGTEVGGSEVQFHGGYSDVFIGRTNVPQRGMVKVAIKRLRFHIKTDKDLAKVHSVFHFLVIKH